MQVCLKDMGDPKSHLLCGSDIPSGIAFRIDDRTGPVPSDDIRAVSKTRYEKLVDDHMFSSFYLMRR